MRDARAPTLSADSEAEATVSHPSHPLQLVQHTHYIYLWAVHRCLRRQYHAGGDILYVSDPLGQTVPQQVDRHRPSQGL